MKKITTAYLNDHSSQKLSIAPLCYSPTYFKANPYAKHPTMPPSCVQIEEWNCLPALSTRLTILSDRCFWWSKRLFHPLLVSHMQVFSSLFNIFLRHYLSLDAAWPAWPNANERNVWRWWFEGVNHAPCHKHLGDITDCCSAVSHMLRPNLNSKPTLKKTPMKSKKLL